MILSNPGTLQRATATGPRARRGSRRVRGVPDNTINIITNITIITIITNKKGQLESNNPYTIMNR